jgi:hypothetical protein
MFEENSRQCTMPYIHLPLRTFRLSLKENKAHKRIAFVQQMEYFM